MGGIGVTIHSKEGKKSPSSTPVLRLPKEVVDEIARQLGISEEAKLALTAGTCDLPDNVDVTITRMSNNEILTVKKVDRGATYRVTYRDESIDVKPR